MKQTGIDAIAFYIPPIFLDIEQLAIHRSIEPAKLKQGLGLNKMALPDSNEDAASFAANALLKLINDNHLDPRTIGRIYLGTESALDAAKPTATYALSAVEVILEERFGSRCFKHCDVLDMTFACVGAVDALHNSIDWVNAGQGRNAVVIASDFAKYELGSPGEYTQGAGAIAMLITEEPSIMYFSNTWGVATEGVGDFHKPRRVHNKLDVLKQTAKILGTELTEAAAKALLESSTFGFWSDTNAQIELFKDEPVFDGQYSNKCYTNRIVEALEHFRSQQTLEVLKDWQYMVFHLPYAYQARRMIMGQWLNWLEEDGSINRLYEEVGEPGEDRKNWMKSVGKSNYYQSFLKEKIVYGERASSEIGNMYTASIFMSMLSVLNTAAEQQQEIAGHKMGFFSYGSGSKSKVFEGTINPGWRSMINESKLFEELAQRVEINFTTYEQLHNNQLSKPIVAKSGIYLENAGNIYPSTGIRTYTML